MTPTTRPPRHTTGAALRSDERFDSFIRECVDYEAGARLAHADLYAAALVFYRHIGSFAPVSRVLAARMEQAGAGLEYTPAGRVWLDVRLKPGIARTATTAGDYTERSFTR